MHVLACYAFILPDDKTVRFNLEAAVKEGSSLLRNGKLGEGRRSSSMAKGNRPLSFIDIHRQRQQRENDLPAFCNLNRVYRHLFNLFFSSICLSAELTTDTLITEKSYIYRNNIMIV